MEETNLGDLCSRPKQTEILFVEKTLLIDIGNWISFWIFFKQGQRQGQGQGKSSRHSNIHEHDMQLRLGYRSHVQGDNRESCCSGFTT